MSLSDDFVYGNDYYYHVVLPELKKILEMEAKKAYHEIVEDAGKFRYLEKIPQDMFLESIKQFPKLHAYLKRIQKEDLALHSHDNVEVNG